jgi:hypothetical protein
MLGMIVLSVAPPAQVPSVVVTVTAGVDCVVAASIVAGSVSVPGNGALTNDDNINIVKKSMMLRFTIIPLYTFIRLAYITI